MIVGAISLRIDIIVCYTVPVHWHTTVFVNTGKAEEIEIEVVASLTTEIQDTTVIGITRTG